MKVGQFILCIFQIKVSCLPNFQFVLSPLTATCPLTIWFLDNSPFAQQKVNKIKNIDLNVSTLDVYTYICTMKIEEAIKQAQFKSEYQKVSINLMFTVSWLTSSIGQTLKPFGISNQQFNILRILRGSYPKTQSVKELTAKMLDRSSNASRLVDKLLDKKLVERSICPSDRRKVEILITDLGLKLTEEASHEIEKMTESIFSKISKNEAKELNRLLDSLRG